MATELKFKTIAALALLLLSPLYLALSSRASVISADDEIALRLVGSWTAPLDQRKLVSASMSKLIAEQVAAHSMSDT
jgi:hypothetical protein